MWQKIKGWKWGNGVLIFLISFFASVIGATFAVSEWMKFVDSETMVHYDIAHSDEDKHFENLMNVFYAVEMQKFAENRDFDGILEKSCQILLRSTSHIAPELWEEGERRQLAEKYKEEANESLTRLIQSGYCPFLADEEKEEISEK